MTQESRYLGLLTLLESYRILEGSEGRTAEFLDGEGTRILEFVEGW